MEVYLRSKVFSAPYTPYYDAYRGHTFKVVGIHYGDRVELTCISDPSVQVTGYARDDELKRA